MTEQSELSVEHRQPKPMVADDLVWIMDTNRFEHMYRIATAMAAAKLMPDHLRNSPPDCMLVVEQSNRWGMSPFAVAQCTFSIGGKLGYEGKLVAAVVNTRGNLKRRLSYTYEGNVNDRNTLAVIVAGTIQGEDEPRTVRVTWKQGESMSKGAKDKWTTQPEQQLAYFGARAWARRHMPEVLLGVYTPDEIAAGLHNGMRDVTPAPKAIERRAAMRNPEPELAELTTADGEVVHKLRGEVEQFLVHQIDEIMDLETLDSFVGLNSLQIAQRQVLEDRIEQIRERLSIKAAPPEPTANGNGNGAVTERAQAIAAALREAPNLGALKTLYQRRQAEIAAMPEKWRARMAEIYDEQLQRHGEHPMAELDDLDGLPPEEDVVQDQGVML